MIENVEQVIRDYLPGVIHMSLATSAGNRPWVCEVHFAFDEDLNLYFRSKPATRHCQEISNNPTVAGNIIEPHGMTDKPRGVYFEGLAAELKEVDEEHPGYLALNKRFSIGAGALENAKLPDGHHFYQISIEKFYLFDTRESKPSQKYELNWVQSKSE